MMSKAALRSELYELEARVIELEVEHEVARKVRYRRMPDMFLAERSLAGGMSDTAKVKHCDRNGGHVLVVTDKAIKCMNCPAEWRDFGF